MLAMDLLRRFGNALNPSLIDNPQWRVELSQEWDVCLQVFHLRLSDELDQFKILGPFPIHAREQHYLSPSFPLDCRHDSYHIVRPVDVYHPQCQGQLISTSSGRLLTLTVAELPGAQPKQIYTVVLKSLSQT
jgi:hypothetical protein